MVEVPAPRFAPSVRGSVAYQSVGVGPTALVVLPPLAQNIEKMWEQPAFWRPIHRLARSIRFVHYDKLGTGSSDPVAAPASLDERVEELVAVLDAAEVDRAWLLGLSEGGIVAIAAAAAIPERVAGLVLVNTTSGGRARPDLERHGPVRTAEETIAYFTDVADRWATQGSRVLADFGPSLRGVPGIESWIEGYERAAASPAMIHSLLAGALSMDATPELSSITVPTLVVHHRGDRVIPVAYGRWLAESIDGARYVELDGDDHFAWVAPSVDELIDTILETIGNPGSSAGKQRGLTPWDTLTSAERRVTRLVQRGSTNAEVAGQLGVSVRTVETQLSRVYGKLGVRSRTELAIRAED
jgi:pimeloyl-ACP methyl ester carboxylesterase/DNA-binding CsgD family transcriptional regulator